MKYGEKSLSRGDNPIVWVADIGSVKRNRFAWCRASFQGQDRAPRVGNDILGLAQGVARDISDDMSVALGFECPLFVPVPENPLFLTSAREGEGHHPWSAGAGCAALACGLSECAWVLDRIRELARAGVRPSLDWDEFATGKANLFIWEAFVTGEAKGPSDRDDAEIAAATFWRNYPHIVEADSVRGDNPFSLVGAALLRSGLTQDTSMLSQKCIVLKS